MFDHCATLWGGFVLTVAGGLRVYHAGDSAYGPFFASIGARYPGIDVAMLPIGAYAPRWFMQTMHIDPEEAVQAAGDIEARVMVPMHWGTFWLSREPALEPIERTHAACGTVGRDRADLWDLAVGESRPIHRLAGLLADKSAQWGRVRRGDCRELRSRPCGRTRPPRSGVATRLMVNPGRSTRLRRSPGG